MERDDLRALGGVDSGSAAVDLSALSELVYGTEAFQPAFDEQLTPAQQKEREQATAHRARRLPLAAAAVGTVLLAVAAALVLLANAMVAQLSAENAALHRRENELREEHRELTVAYETCFNRGELERYATQVLCMSRPQQDQIRVLPEQQEDRVEKLDENLGRGTISRELRTFLSALMEYFA